MSEVIQESSDNERLPTTQSFGRFESLEAAAPKIARPVVIDSKRKSASEPIGSSSKGLLSQKNLH